MADIDVLSIAMQFAKPELLFLLLVLYYAGTRLKDSAMVKDWMIPLTLLVLSLLFCVPYVVIVGGNTAIGWWMGFAQGFVIWAIEGQIYATVKQVLQKRK